MTTVLDRLRSDRPVFSVEFFPPRSDDEEDVLWRAIRQLEVLDPAFVSVTYGAGGSSRDRTIRTTARIAAETTLLPVAHLTGVEHSIRWRWTGTPSFRQGSPVAAGRGARRSSTPPGWGWCLVRRRRRRC